MRGIVVSIQSLCPTELVRPPTMELFSLRERLRTHKIFTKDQCFYLNYSKFSIKSYVLDVY